MRVVFLNQADFPVAAPFLDAFFAQDGIWHCAMWLEIDELLDVVSLSKARNSADSMLVNTLAQIAGHADIERSVGATGKDVDEGVGHDGSLAHLLVVGCVFFGASSSGFPYPPPRAQALRGDDGVTAAPTSCLRRWGSNVPLCVY